MKYLSTLLISVGIFYSYASANAQQSDGVAILEKTDAAITTYTRHSYQVTFRFKSAPKTDTSRRNATVYLFSDGLAQNDTLKSYVIEYPDKIRTEAFDGRYYYDVNHIKKTIRRQDAAQDGYKKTVTGWARDFAYQPLLRKTARHFLPDVYKTSKISATLGTTGAPYQIEHTDSTLNDWKIAAFDPDYITTKTVFEIDPVSFQLRKMTRWVWFMKTPQYDETIFTSYAALSDTASFTSFFNPDAYVAAGYVDYDTYKKNQDSGKAELEEKKVDVFPPFQLPDTDGQTFHSDSLNKGLILVDFWYRSCYPCLKAMPVLESLHQKYKDKGLVVLGINSFDTSAVEIRTFMKARQANYTALLDIDKRLTHELRITGFPRVFLIDAASKKVLFYQAGYSDETEGKLEPIISQILGGE